MSMTKKVGGCGSFNDKQDQESHDEYRIIVNCYSNVVVIIICIKRLKS